MDTKNEATLPNLPAVPAMYGKEWPVGFKPQSDVIELKRTIRVSASTYVEAEMTTKGGKAEIKVSPKNIGYGRQQPGSILLVDVEAVVIAMNILRDWIKEESDKLRITPEPPAKMKTVKAKPDPDDGEEEDEDEFDADGD